MAKISVPELEVLLDYNPITGLVRRKVKLPGDSRSTKEWFVGGVTEQGYARIRVAGKKYMVHVLAWALTYGEWPEGEIDHEDGNRLNNKLYNLRDTDDRGNARNKKKNSNNKSGTSGVYWCRREKRYIVVISTDYGKKQVGRFTDKSKAIVARKLAEVEQGYHPNHGRD